MNARTVHLGTLVAALAVIGLCPSAHAADSAVSQAPLPLTLPQVSVSQATVAPLVTAAENDPAWKSPAAIPSLGLSSGTTASGLQPLPTTVGLLWDANNLYIRFVCYGGDAYCPPPAPDGGILKGDVVEAFIDPVGDSREFVEIEVSPKNNNYNFLHLLTADPVSGPDGILLPQVSSLDQWDFPGYQIAGLRTAAAPTADGKGWIVDIAIPAKSLLHRLGENQFAPMTFRANFLRYEHLPNPAAPDQRTFVAMNWSTVVWGRPHRSPGAMGYVTLVGANPNQK